MTTFSKPLVSIFGLAVLAGACSRAPLNTESQLQDSSFPSYAVVKNCKGVMNNDWLAPGTTTPVKGELTVNVQTTPGTKTIVSAFVNFVIPGHTMVGSEEYVHSGTYEVNYAKVKNVTKYKRRGEIYTVLNMKPGQTIQTTTEGSTESSELQSVAVSNGDGADYVNLVLVFKPNGAAAAITQKFSLDGCMRSNSDLLLSNIP